MTTEDVDDSGSEGSGGDEPDDNPDGDQDQWWRRLDYGRKLVFPGLTLLFLILILVAFHKILLPFVFACAIVYLMEPIVQRLSRSPDDPRGLPRWVTVILVYLVFFSTVTVSGLLIIPRLAGEVQRFGDTVPKNIQTFREESLPGLNEKIQSYLKAVDSNAKKDTDGKSQAVEQASKSVLRARDQATDVSRAFGQAHRRVRRAGDLEEIWSGDEGAESRRRAFRPRSPVPGLDDADHGRTGRWRWGDGETSPAFWIKPGPDGFGVYLEPEGVEFKEVGDGTWKIQPPGVGGDEGAGKSTSDGLHNMFDLEERLEVAVEEAVSFSNEQIASMIEFAQELVVGVLEAFIAIILTLMVAAFISIDLPRFMGFFRDLVPDHWNRDYDELLVRVDRGLAGVVRGQLLICVINGVLTYIGLVIFQVKFALMLALVAGVLSIIPVFGAVISTIPICLIALTQSFMTAVLILGWILVIHFIEANLLNPKIIGTSAEIHPVIVIFALLAGESTGGLVGAILGVPVASIVLSLFKFTRDKVWDQKQEETAAREEARTGGEAGPDGEGTV